MSQEATNVEAFESLVKVAAHGGPPPVDVKGVFTLAAISPVKGEAYFCVHCVDCKKVTPAFRDAARGNLPEYFRGCYQMRLHLRCQHCQCHIDVPAKELRTVLWI